MGDWEIGGGKDGWLVGLGGGEGVALHELLRNMWIESMVFFFSVHPSIYIYLLVTFLQFCNVISGVSRKAQIPVDPFAICIRH